MEKKKMLCGFCGVKTKASNNKRGTKTLKYKASSVRKDPQAELEKSKIGKAKAKVRKR